MVDESERKSRKLQNHVCLQVLDGEAQMYKHEAQAKEIKTKIDLVIEQGKGRMNAFQFPDPGKFKMEDDDSESEIEQIILEQALSLHTSNLY